MTTKPLTREHLASLDLGELRRTFSKSTGLGPGTRKQTTLIEGILAAQTEAAPGDDDWEDDQDDDKGVQKPEGTTEASSDSEGTTTDQGPQNDPAPEPTKVKVSGTGAHAGSTLLCDLLSSTGVIATVRVLGSDVRFRASSGEPVRVRKSWASAGWVLDTDSLPEMMNPTIEELVEHKPADLSVDQLRAVYKHLSGRPSTSESRTYLCNRIRMARQGTLPSGTRRSRSGEPQKVLPVAMAVSVVEALDEAWRRNGYGSRIAFIREAIVEKLVELGEGDVAELVLR